VCDVFSSSPRAQEFLAAAIRNHASRAWGGFFLFLRFSASVSMLMLALYAGSRKEMKCSSRKAHRICACPIRCAGRHSFCFFIDQSPDGRFRRPAIFISVPLALGVFRTPPRRPLSQALAPDGLSSVRRWDTPSRPRFNSASTGQGKNVDPELETSVRLHYSVNSFSAVPVRVNLTLPNPHIFSGRGSCPGPPASSMWTRDVVRRSFFSRILLSRPLRRIRS